MTTDFAALAAELELIEEGATIWATDVVRLRAAAAALRDAERYQRHFDALLPEVERILDEKSAWIARPSKGVSREIALSLAIVAQRMTEQEQAEFERLAWLPDTIAPVFVDERANDHSAGWNECLTTIRQHREGQQ